MNSNLRTTIIGVAILATVAYGMYTGTDKETIALLIGALTAGGFMLAKDAKK